MVIVDEIAEKVQLSVDSVQQSIRLLNEGNLTESFFRSKTAFVSSGNSFDSFF
jgi:hypothetical protein